MTIDFTIDTPWLYIVLFMADVWQWTPFIFVILLAGLAAIPTRSTRQRTSTARSRSRRFVTLPLLLPIILIAVTFRLIDAAKMFDIIFSPTRGGPGTDTYTTTYFLYQQGFELFHLGQGTAGAWMFMIMLSFISFWLVRRLLKPLEEEAREHRRRPRPVGAGHDRRRPRWPLPHRELVRYAFLALYVAFLLLPLYWMAVTSIKSQDDQLSGPARLVPDRPDEHQLRRCAQSLQRLEGLENSLIVSVRDDDPRRVVRHGGGLLDGPVSHGRQAPRSGSSPSG